MGNVKEVDHGYSKIVNEIKKLKGSRVAVGVLSSAGNYGDREGSVANLAEVATWNEYGVPGMIPSRPFMSQAFEKNIQLLNAKKKELITLLEFGQITEEEALATLGEFFVALTQKEIQDGDFEANRPSTIAQKGSSHPLIDTGRLRQSITYEVRRKNG